MSERLDYATLWKLLWLHPDISSLTKSLLPDTTWNYQSAFLLEIILEMQIIYQEYRQILGNSTPTAGVEVPGEEALLSLAEVVEIANAFSKDLITYHTNNHNAAIDRELQSRVSGTSPRIIILQLID